MLKEWVRVFQLDDWDIDVKCYPVQVLGDDSHRDDETHTTAEVIHDHNCKLATIRIATAHPPEQISLDIAHELTHIATAQHDALFTAVLEEHGLRENSAVYGERHVLYEQIAVRISRAFGRFKGLPT